MDEISKIIVNGALYSIKDSSAIRNLASPLLISLALGGIAHTKSIQENTEWVMLLVDAENKIIAGVRKDGSMYYANNNPSKLFSSLVSLYNS